MGRPWLEPKAAAGLPGRVGGRVAGRGGRLGPDVSYGSRTDLGLERTRRRGVLEAPTSQSWISNGSSGRGGGQAAAGDPRRKAGWCNLEPVFNPVLKPRGSSASN